MDKTIKQISAEPAPYFPGNIRVYIWGHAFVMEIAEAQELRDDLNTALGMVAH